MESMKAVQPLAAISKPSDFQAPLAPGQPHIGIVLLWYPVFTQPFIFREVEELARIMPVKVYTLYGKNELRLSGEMLHSRISRQTYGLRAAGSVFRKMCKFIIAHPRLFCKLLKRSLFHKWPSLEVFGENLWAFAVGFSLGPRFREDGIDFAYAPWPRGAATAAWVGATLANIPFGIAARGDNLLPADPDLANKFAASALVRANNAADKIRIESFADKEAANKTTLIYNSLSLHAPASQTARRFTQKTLKLLAVGRFDVTKGFDILLEACGILKKNGCSFSLTLAGGGGKIMGLGSETSRILELRKTLGLEKEVCLPGLVSHDELPSLLENHDIFIAPCVIHSSGRRDGIPNTVIEAMTYGMPIISTNVNALPEVIKDGETGLLVEPANPQAIAEAICAMQSDPEKAELLGKNAAQLARDLFDPAANAARLQQMFQKAAS